ncbi:hypothetical protein QFZ76_009458 [Streptomyces sp. V4I2]|nr:hypothetical protein [Streptomyces sp. V4I2]
MRVGAVDVADEGGVDVPRDMSVVGYDDSHLSHLMPIGLTTVRQDAAPREAVLDPKLVVRGTSGPAPESEA